VPVPSTVPVTSTLATVPPTTAESERGEEAASLGTDPATCLSAENGSTADLGPCGLNAELSRLEQIAHVWDDAAQVRIAVILSDGSVHGVGTDERTSSASAVKPLWTAAAIDAAGLAAVEPSAPAAIVSSSNHAAGEMIDLAGGIDNVNRWVHDVAGLEDTDLAVWSFGTRRVSSLVSGNRTTVGDLARFYERLHRRQLLEPAETERLMGWLRQTPRQLSPFDGALVDRLPSAVAETALHKTGWLPPGHRANNSPLIIDGGLVVLPDGDWFALALSNSNGKSYIRSVKWLGLAACLIYVLVADHLDHDCGHQDDPPYSLG